jgi:hypothetical protein
MATRYRRDKQKLQIEGQTIQWPQDTDEIKSVSCGHCIVWPLMWSFCWSRQYLVAFVLSDLWFIASVYLVGIFWPLYTEPTNRRSDNTMATRYRRDKQKLQIEGQTIQWPQDTDQINRSYKSKVRHLLLLFISSVSCGHCIVWPSICSFSLTRRYPLAIIFSDLR